MQKLLKKISHQLLFAITSVRTTSSNCVFDPQCNSAYSYNFMIGYRNYLGEKSESIVVKLRHQDLKIQFKTKTDCNKSIRGKTIQIFLYYNVIFANIGILQFLTTTLLRRHI